MPTVTSNTFQATVSASVATIIVRADGGGDYTTLQAALNGALPGDIIEMQADTPGGTWTYTSDVNVSGVSGTTGGEIIVRVRENDRVNMYPSGSPSRLFQMANCSYLKFDGSVGDWYIGDRSLWSSTNGGTSSFTHEVTFQLTNNCHHIDVVGIHFSGGNGYAAIIIGGNAAATSPCHHVRLLDCTGRNHGHLRTASVTGDGIAFGGYSQILDGFDGWRFGGHNQLQGSANRLVVRNCTFDGDWQTDQGANSGYRVWGYQSVDTNNFGYDSEIPWGPILVDGNITKGGGWLGAITGRSSNARVEVGGRWSIHRYNYDFDNVAEDGLFMEAASDRGDGYISDYNNTIEFLRCYNNTEDNNYGWHHDVGISAGKNGKEYRFYNNIISNCTAGLQARLGGWLDVNIASRRNTKRDSDIDPTLQGYPDTWLGRKYVNNMIDADTVGVELHWFPSTPDQSYTGRQSTLSGAKSKWPSVWDTTNNTNAPTYVNAVERTKAGYALDTGSNGIGDAVHMATVTSPSSGDTITVDDAFWMYDGAGRFDLSYFGEVGDYIAIYNSDGVSNLRIVQVDTINSQTSVTLTSTVTVANGDKIWPSDGVKAFKNRGAAQ